MLLKPCDNWTIQNTTKKVDEDYTREHEKNIQTDISKLLRPVNSRTPVFYMLPKIHKTNNLGRPVVSSVNSHTEKISAYVDGYLRPLAERLPSYIRDATDFIKRLRALLRLPMNCLLVTLDVSSLYTNIVTNGGLAIVRQELEKSKSGQNKPSAETITLLLEKVLKLNNFTFRDLNYIQIKGTAMSTRFLISQTSIWAGSKTDLYTRYTGMSMYWTGYALLTTYI